jgi:signal transduction histidine kinase
MIEFNPEVFNLNLLVNNIYQLFDKSVEDKKIRLTKNIEEDFLVFADSNMLNTIIRNLVSNSIKFTPQNGEINISVYKENNKTILTISDTGIGISKENQEKLFNFGTNYSTLGTNNEKGTGLGLILVFEFIQKHNGDIKIDSEIGKGTKFIITIPDA